MVGMERCDFLGPMEEYVFFGEARNTRIKNSNKLGNLGGNKQYG